MRVPRLQQLQQNLKQHEANLAQFQQFITLSQKRINNNLHLPGIHLDFLKEGCAELQIYGDVLSLRCGAIERGQRIHGTITVSQVVLDEEQIQNIYYFDNLGNVFASPDESSTIYNLDNGDFVELLVCDISEEYLKISTKNKTPINATDT